MPAQVTGADTGPGHPPVRAADKRTEIGILRLQAGPLGLATAGVVLGLAGSFALARLVSGFVFGVAPRDPVTFLVAPLVLLAVAAFAAFVPARRAMAVDPMGAIRAD